MWKHVWIFSQALVLAANQNLQPRLQQKGIWSKLPSDPLVSTPSAKDPIPKLPQTDLMSKPDTTPKLPPKNLSLEQSLPPRKDFTPLLPPMNFLPKLHVSLKDPTSRLRQKNLLPLMSANAPTSRPSINDLEKMARKDPTPKLPPMNPLSNFSPRHLSARLPPRNLTENCPRECFCSKTLSSVNCAGKGLTALPARLPSKVVKLFLDHNKLTTLPPCSFKGLQSLAYLTLEFNKIISIQEYAFKGARSLSTLLLANNMITDVDQQGFDGLDNLQILQIGENKLRRVISLGYTPNLQQLIMQGNNLLKVTFPADTENLQSLYDITLSANQITNLTGFSFLALKNAKVRKLDVAKNVITDISADAFVPLTQLQSLKLGTNPLTQKALKTALKGIRSPFLASMDVSGANLEGPIDASIWTPFTNLTLRNLKLSQNNLRKIGSGNFKALKHLYSLDLTDCQITKIDEYGFSGLTSLTQLRLGGNQLSLIPKDLPKTLKKLYFERNSIATLYKESFAQLKILEELHLEQNEILRLETECFVGLSSLKKLYLEGNKLAVLPGQVFSPLQQLTSLELKDNHLQQIPDESDVFSSMSSLVYLNLAENLCKQMPLNLFTGMTELQYLHLENNQLGGTIESDSTGSLFRGLLKLRELYLGNNDIRSLPEPMFRSLIQVTQIKLEDNKISQWAEHTFGMTKELANLDVSNNLIYTLNQTSLKDLQKVQYLNLTGNPFSCDCDLRWFRDWMNTTSVQVVMAHSYKCNSPPDWQGRSLQSFSRGVIDCTDRTPYYISAGVSAGVLGTAILLVVMYRYRWVVKLRLHRARVIILPVIKKKGYQPLPGANRQFDGYISFTDADREWVIWHLLPVVDNGQMGDRQFEGAFKLCLEDRDFVPGETVVANIDTCMRTSRKVLIVLSKDYLKDSRCLFELGHAFHMANVEHEVEELVLIKKGRLRVKDIPKVVTPMVERREFVEWVEDDEDGQENFVAELTRRLQERKPPHFQEV